MFVSFKALGDAFNGFQGDGSEFGSERASGKPVGIALLGHECEGCITDAKSDREHLKVRAKHTIAFITRDIIFLGQVLCRDYEILSTVTEITWITMEAVSLTAHRRLMPSRILVYQSSCQRILQL